jgi:hypothetical protein
LTKKYKFTHIKDRAIKHGLPKARKVAAKIARGEALLANENSVPKEAVHAVDVVFSYTKTNKWQFSTAR